MRAEEPLQEITLSVLVVSLSGTDSLDRCLASLKEQTARQNIEVIVITNAVTSEAADSLCTNFPHVVFLNGAAKTVPQKRAVGLARCSGEIVALIEDDCLVPGDWCAAVIAAHKRNSEIAIGGAVQPGNYRSWLDWGIFFCEYGRYLKPFEGVVTALPGNNVSYKRRQLQVILQEQAQENFYEVFVHGELQQRGQSLKADAAIYVQNFNSSWRLSNVVQVPFHHGRGFAGLRFSKQSWRRFFYLGVACLLPALQTYRILKQVLPRKGYRQRVAQALPGIMLFWTSWSAGEFVGYLFGPGRSLQQWR